MVVPFLQNSTFTGLISTRDYGNSLEWQQAYKLALVSDNTIAHYLSTNNVIISSVVINGDIISLGSLASFNQGIATGLYSFAANTGDANGINSFAANQGEAAGTGAGAFNNARARGVYSIGTGFDAEAAGDYSHVEGSFTAASGVAAHAEGTNTIAFGDYSHAQGDGAVAQGLVSHAEGDRSQALGDYTHAEGQLTEAKGTVSHTAGFKSTAANNYTWVWSDGSLGTITENVSTTKEGQFMIDASGGVYIPGTVGIGTDSTDNALTVNGSVSALTVYANNYLSGNINLLDALSAGVGRIDVNTAVIEGSANWNSTYTTVTTKSADWDTAYSTATTYQVNSSTYTTTDFITSNFLSISGGTITGNLSVNGDGYFKQNVTIVGNLTALGTTTFANTVLNTSTSALSVVNVGPGPALYVYQGPGAYDVASFVDGDGIEVLHVGNAGPGGLGKVGINTSFPNTQLTVNGEVSSNSVIYSLNGNSDSWNNAATTIQNTTGTTTFLQSNSSYFLTQDNNLTLDTNAPPDYFYAVFDETRLIKVNQQNSLILGNSGDVLPVNGTGNAFSGTISYNLNNTNVILSAIFPSSYHINYNNLDQLYGVTSDAILFGNLTTTISAIRFPNLKICTGSIGIQSLMSLTEVDFQQLEHLRGNFTMGGYITIGFSSENLKELNFPKLRMIDGSFSIGGYGLNYSPLLSSINLNNLQRANTIGIGSSIGSTHPNRFYRSLKELNFPKLIDVSLLSFNNLTEINILNFPQLKKLRGGTVITACSALRELNFPELEYCIGGYLYGSSSGTPSLTSIFAPKVKILTPGIWNVITDAGLRNFEVGTNTLSQYIGTLQCNQVLTQQSVDNVLKSFSRLDGTNNTVAYSGGTITLAGGNSAPSYTGGVTTTSLGSNFHRTNTIVTAYVTTHGHSTNDIVTFTGNGQAALNGTYVVRVSSVDQFEYTTTTSSNLTGSSTVTMRKTTVPTDGFRYFQNIVLRNNTVTINLP